jgi:PAS domain-containing protein
LECRKEGRVLFLSPGVEECLGRRREEVIQGTEFLETKVPHREYISAAIKDT